MRISHRYLELACDYSYCGPDRGCLRCDWTHVVRQGLSTVGKARIDEKPISHKWLRNETKNAICNEVSVIHLRTKGIYFLWLDFKCILNFKFNGRNSWPSEIHKVNYKFHMNVEHERIVYPLHSSDSSSFRTISCEIYVAGVCVSEAAAYAVEQSRVGQFVCSSSMQGISRTVREPT